MKKFLAVLLILISVTAFNVTPKCASLSAYTVIEQTSGRVLYSCNGDSKMPMASTTKVMTAVLVIENLDLEKEYTVPDEAIGIEGSSIYLKKGEVLTGMELLYGLMMASGNDAAHALAILTSGSTDEFIYQMNMKAQELGLKNTHFADPCGLRSDGHYTTSNDLAFLCAYAMKNPLFCQVVATKNYQIRGVQGTRYLYNKNRILGEFEGGNGIKTGYTRAAGRCLCSSAKRDNMQIISVVLNDYNWFNNSKALMEKAFNEYSMVQIAKKDKIVTSVNISGSNNEKCDIITGEDVFYPLKKGEYIRAKYDVVLNKQAPVKKGESAGKVYFYLNDSLVKESFCVFNNDIQKHHSLFGG
ncbi:MAG: D-alanyl-D-alanine carboxypeptidase [Clostridiales bacterium]|nr:D-alanyl-D-alanine carboxypeptidase [Clostridiales bacterium]